MKSCGSLIFVIISFFLFSCEKVDNSISSFDNQLINSSSDISNVPYASISISKTINGVTGGSIALDTTYTDPLGNIVTIYFSITFDPCSFTGTKQITATANPATISMQFTPAMQFIKPAKLNLTYKGIDLKKLGFDTNTKVDFAFIDVNNKIEIIQKDEVKINLATQELSTKKALLPHFSRYAFIRKSQ